MEQNQTVNIKKVTYKRIVKCHGKQALQVSLSYPRLVSEDFGARKINRYYQVSAERWRERWEGELYRQVCQGLEEDITGALPWETAFDFTETYNRDGLLSLYTDAYEFTGGAHGNTVRRGDTWEVATGTPRTLYSFFPGVKRPKQHIIEQILEEARKQNAGGEHLFFEEYETKIREQFDPNRFYLTEQGIAVFYPLYAISPYAEGVPTFFLTK